MSDLSAEVIVNDFNKLKDMFSNMKDEEVWEKFALYNFDFNKTLNSLLGLETDLAEQEDDDIDLRNAAVANIISDEDNENKKSNNKINKKKSFNVMETLGNIFNQNKNKTSTEAYDYHKLD